MQCKDVFYIYKYVYICLTVGLCYVYFFVSFVYAESITEVIHSEQEHNTNTMDKHPIEVRIEQDTEHFLQEDILTTIAKFLDEDIIAKDMMTTGMVHERVINKKGEEIGYYENGSMAYVLPLHNGEKDGIYSEYRIDGQLLRTIEYKNNLLHGTMKEYYINGNAKRISIWKENILHGDYIELYDDGKSKLEGEYYKGKRHGKFTEYHDNGNIRRIRIFRKGVITGVEKEFNRNGTIKNFIRHN